MRYWIKPVMTAGSAANISPGQTRFPGWGGSRPTGKNKRRFRKIDFSGNLLLFPIDYRLVGKQNQKLIPLIFFFGKAIDNVKFYEPLPYRCLEPE